MSKLNDELFKDEKLEKAVMGKLYGGKQWVVSSFYMTTSNREDCTWDYR